MADVTAYAGRTVFVTGASGIVGSWLVRALLSAGATSWPSSATRTRDRNSCEAATSGESPGCTARWRTWPSWSGSWSSTRWTSSSTWVRRPRSVTHSGNRSRRWRPTSEGPTTCWKPSVGSGRRSARSSSPRATRRTARAPRFLTPSRIRWPGGTSMTRRRAQPTCSALRTAPATTCRSGSPVAPTSTAAATSTGIASCRARSDHSCVARRRSSAATGRSGVTTSMSTMPSPRTSALGAALLDGRERAEAFNFGHGRPVSVLEIVDAIGQAVGRPDLAPVIRSDAPNEIPAQWLDSSKADEPPRLDAGADARRRPGADRALVPRGARVTRLGDRR